MPQVAGQNSSYDLPQYIGELFRKNRQPNAVLRAIGGLTGGIRLVRTRKFPLNVDYQLAAAAQPAILEGAAPTKSSESTSQSSNITQIFQYGIEHTYSAQSVVDEISGVAVIPGAPGQVGLIRPGSLEWQIQRKLEKLQDDVNYTIINGAFQEPVDNTTARKTRGFKNALTTNLYNAATTGGTPIADRAAFEAILADWMSTNRMFDSGAEIFVFADETELAWLMGLYEDAKLSQPPMSREEVGLMIKTVNARWARLNLVFDPMVPAQELHFLQPQVCRLVGMPIVSNGMNKGVIFVEPLSKAGSSDTLQLYAELGLDYGAEWLHGRIYGRGAA